MYTAAAQICENQFGCRVWAQHVKTDFRSSHAVFTFFHLLTAQSHDSPCHHHRSCVHAEWCHSMCSVAVANCSAWWRQETDSLSHSPQTLNSLISHRYTEEFRSHNYIMICVRDRLLEYIVCIWYSCCMMKNEQLKVRSFGADFLPKSMFSRANSPTTHHNWSSTSVKHASHHHTCCI